MKSVLCAPEEQSLFPFSHPASILFQQAAQDREDFWEKQAECVHWFQRWEQVLNWQSPYAQWFVGGKLNACYNCVDRHMASDTRQKIALLWEGERGEERSLTYEELSVEVQRCANVLKALGVRKSDRVAVYLPMIPEAIIVLLSCARIGAIHTVVFGGFSSEALRDRILDANAKVVITADGGFRRGKQIPLKESVDQALISCPSVEHVLVVKHTGSSVNMSSGRDHWYAEWMQQVPPVCPAEEMDAEDILYILYTSGTTGKPKGIVHTTGGYMVGVTVTMRWVFDVQPDDIYWCTADVGWVTGHSYVVYGPLSNGMTQLIYEGAPDWPHPDRLWRLIEKYKVSIFYTAPTAIRACMKWGDEWLQGRDLSSLRVLGSVGEPINPEAWSWYFTHVGKGNCPVIDTWWQTETGSILIAPIPGYTPLKPGSVTYPLPGIEAGVVDTEYQPSAAGSLVIRSPWPSMLRGIYNDAERYEQTYWKEGVYVAGDNARCDEQGNLWMMGRNDDVLNVSGHRLGTAEIESALIEHSSVAESAAVGVSHPIKGQAVICFVSLKDGVSFSSELEEQLTHKVVTKIGSVARPEKILCIYELPKTRSGKIMRRLLRDIAEGKVLGDITTLSDPSVLSEIRALYTK